MHPLDGIKVLDLSRILAGPWCTQTLADLGAEVWKIEECASGDDTRGWPPDLNGESTYFQCCNRSKLSLAIDLKQPEGRALVVRLAERADVLVENFRQGALDRLGLGYSDLTAINPRLIYCSISGYGRTGPRAGEAGYDFAIQAESGLMSITGEPNGAPMKVGVAITDVVTGMNATQAILAALIARGRTGRGQHLDIALLDSAVALLANVASSYLGTDKTPDRFGNAHPSVVPYELFETQDGVFVLACGNDSQFRAMCGSVLGRPAMAADPRYASGRQRAQNRDTLIPELAILFRQQPTAYWIRALGEAGVPAGQVRSVPQVLASDEAKARNYVLSAPDALHGDVRLVASPLRLSDTSVRPPIAPPRLGANSRQVLAEALGLTDEEITSLAERNVIRDEAKPMTAPSRL